MAITRYTLRSPSLSAWRDSNPVSGRFATLFEDAPGPLGSNGGSWTPAMSIEETKDELLLTAELPGLTEADISIELENNVLTIGGEKTEQRTEGDEERRHHLWERRYGPFKRGFKLPTSVNGDGVRARFDHGVLLVTLPKALEAKGRKIEIEQA